MRFVVSTDAVLIILSVFSAPPTRPKTDEPGTKCYSGIEIGGSPELARYGVSNPKFEVVTCDPGHVCSTLMGNPIFPGGRFRGKIY